MLFATLCYLSVITLQLITASEISNEDARWLNQSQSHSFEESRASRYDWTGILDNPECPGNVLNLGPGQGTRIFSHKSFGKKPYPADYMVSTGYV